MKKISKDLISEKAEEIRKEMKMERGTGSEVFSGKKDLLHLLLKANMSPELKESERMTDDEGEFKSRLCIIILNVSRL